MPTIQNRRATAAQWTAANPVLAAGEIGFELDTNAIKVGDGLTPWKTLPYLSDESLKTLVESGRLSEAALNDAYALRWKPNEPVVVGAVRTSPGGELVRASEAHTAGATFDPTKWVPVVPLAGDPTPLLDTLAAKADFAGAGRLSLAVVSDSTANAPDEWLRLWMRRYWADAAFPSNVRGEYNAWNATANEWEQTVDQEGVDQTDDGIAVEDTFTRTGALRNSMSDSGDVWWFGSSGGAWASDGSSASASGAASVGLPVGSTVQTVRLDLLVTTLAPAVDQVMRVWLCANEIGTSGVWLNFTVSTAGVWSCSNFKRLNDVVGIGGISATDIGVTDNAAAPQEVGIDASVAEDGTVTITATGPTGTTKTITATLTPAESANLKSEFMLTSTVATDRHQIDYIKVTRPTRQPDGDALIVWNGAIAGARLSTFSSVKRDDMFSGKRCDALVVSIGHNHGVQRPDDFTDELESFVTAFQSEHPECKQVMVCSQNPEYEPQTQGFIDFHRRRQAAVKAVARRKGWDYLPVFEWFASRPNRGREYVQSDGIHPTNPPYGVTTGAFGSVLWADRTQAMVRARRQVGRG